MIQRLHQADIYILVDFGHQLFIIDRRTSVADFHNLSVKHIGAILTRRNPISSHSVVVDGHLVVRRVQDGQLLE